MALLQVFRKNRHRIDPARPARAIAAALLLAGCHSGSSAPSEASKTASLRATFDENPVPFRPTGCNASSPGGWYTNVRVQETAGVAFTASTLTQKLDANAVAFLQESFNSRFGACSGLPFAEGMILANGAVCGIVGVCTADSYRTYQFQLAGTDANRHAVSFDSPLLQLGPR